MNTNASSLSLVLLFLFSLFIYVFEAEGVELCYKIKAETKALMQNMFFIAVEKIKSYLQEIIRLC